ncbi:MAG: hypothetical protein JWO83_531 [Caulobacteraceae bacterium]|nr:hypothetical protein [Caulobacteraceae bacterium]
MDFHATDGSRTSTHRASLLQSCSTAALGLAAAAMISAASPPPAMSEAAKAQFLNNHIVNTARWTPMVLSRPPVTTRLKAAAARPGGAALSTNALLVGTTVPYWTTTIKSPLDNNTYTVSMVGSSPYAANPSNTNVTYVPVAVRIHLGGFVLDPSAPSHCDAQSPARRFFNSPLFRPGQFTSNGANVSAVPGGTQLISAFQRANFWNKVQGTSYGVTLVPSRLDTIVVDWYPTDPLDFVGGVHDDCGGVTPVAFVNINEFNSELLAIAATYAKPNQVPISLADDVAIYVGANTNNCCVLGYHNAVPVPGGTQLYAVGAYFDTHHVFGGRFPDITVWTHELGELIDDPFVQSIPGVPGGTSNDLTPAWGHTGQVGGCQNNLETGDPLTPAQLGNFGVFPVTGVGGFTYHYQDLAFHDWFYRTASTSTGGAGSFKDGLAGGGQGPCS